MREKHVGMEAWSKKAAALMIAGALAASMVPATALAATVAQGGNSQATTKQLASTANDPAHKTALWADGAWVKDPKLVTDGVYQWRTTIKGDGAHYGHYDAFFTFTVKNKVLTAVDLTSTGSTFGGQWGTITPKSTNITGYLPAGVSVAGTTTQNAANGAAVKVGLAGTDQYGGATVSAITLCNVKDGKLETKTELVQDPADGDWDEVETVIGYNVADSLKAAAAEAAEQASVTRARPGAGGPTLATTSSVDTSVVNWNHQDQSFTLTDPAAYNMAKVTYKIGDYFVFDQYIALDGANGKGVTYDVRATDLDAAPSGIGAKNRDVYTAAAYAVMLQRQLMSWSEATAGGAKTDLDVVSAATKSSDSLKEAVYALDGYVYPAANHDNPQDLMGAASWGKLFTSVSDQLEVTIDKGKASASTLWDQTSVTTNAAGDYVLTYKLSDDLPVSSLAFFSSPGKLNIQQMWQLPKTDTNKVEEFVTKNTADHGICAALGNDEVSSSKVTWDAAKKTVTITKGSGINYVVVGLGVGKLAQGGICGVPYSLEEMAAATQVTNQIKAMSATDYAAVTAARAAYNALSPDARTFVGRAEVAKLNAANPAAPKPAAPVAKTVAQKLTVSNLSKSYTISSIKSGKLKAAKSFSLKTTGAKGKVTYQVSSIGKTAKKYLTLTSAGKVTVKKGTPVGTYTLKVKARAAKAVAGTTTYPAASVTKTVTVVVGSQSLTLGTKSKTYKAATLKKKAQTLKVTAKTSSGKISSVKVTKAVNAKKKAVKGFKATKVSNKQIKLTVPKKLARGTYTVTVQVKAPKVAKKYVAATLTRTITVKVK